MARPFSNGIGSDKRQQAVAAGRRSGFELDFESAATAAGASLAYEPTRLNYFVSASYTPDWLVTPLTLPAFYVETKGYFTDADRQKLLRVKQSNPGLDLRIVFQSNPHRPCRKGGKLTWSQWCDRNGFPWALKVMPEEWLT